MGKQQAAWKRPYYLSVRILAIRSVVVRQANPVVGRGQRDSGHLPNQKHFKQNILMKICPLFRKAYSNILSIICQLNNIGCFLWVFRLGLWNYCLKSCGSVPICVSSIGLYCLSFASLPKLIYFANIGCFYFDLSACPFTEDALDHVVLLGCSALLAALE